MHQVIAWFSLVGGASLLLGCVDPLGTTPPQVDDSTFVAELARRPKPPWPVPDSVGIPPSPVPPIYEEVPLAGDGSQ